MDGSRFPDVHMIARFHALKPVMPSQQCGRHSEDHDHVPLNLQEFITSTIDIDLCKNYSPKMPKAQSGSIQRRKADRNAPAPYAKPTEAHTEPDKENQDPVQQPSDNATNGKATPPSNDPLQDRTPVSPDNSNEAHNESAQSEKPSDYKDIVLEEIGGEVPCYENVILPLQSLACLANP